MNTKNNNTKSEDKKATGNNYTHVNEKANNNNHHNEVKLKNEENYNYNSKENNNHPTNSTTNKKTNEKKTIKILQNGGMINAYQYLMESLSKNGLPTGDLFEYAAYTISNYEKKWKLEKAKEVKEKINKYREDLETAVGVGGGDDHLHPKNLNKSVDSDNNNQNPHHQVKKSITDLKRSNSTKKIKRSKSPKQRSSSPILNTVEGTNVGGTKAGRNIANNIINSPKSKNKNNKVGSLNDVNNVNNANIGNIVNNGSNNKKKKNNNNNNNEGNENSNLISSPKNKSQNQSQAQVIKKADHIGKGEEVLTTKSSNEEKTAASNKKNIK